MDAIGTLGEDLLLLSIRPDQGNIATLHQIDYGLMGAELVRLAALGRIDIADNRIVVQDSSATGDAELDAALASITQARRPPRPRAWVGKPRHGIRDAYLARLVSAGAIQAGPQGIFGRARWQIAAPARVAEARTRLDTIANSSGTVGTAEAAFGGLAHAVGLDRMLYPGFGGRQLRKRLTEVAKGQWTVTAVSGAVADSVRSATDAAIMASTAAATQAAVDAAVQAAIAASAAATSAG
jgi:Golgi phosphoprotein 3 (GPP34)